MPNCIEENCNNIAKYNYKNLNIKIYCVNHKKKDMICLEERSKYCLDCSKKANFNYEGLKKAIYCSDHKKNNMIIDFYNI